MVKRSPKGEGVIPIPQLGHKVFPGNTQEINTLIPTIDDLKKEFSVENIDFAADRGMFSEANIETLEKAKLIYVVASKLKNISKQTKTEILKINDNYDNNHFKISETEYKGRRLVIVYSPARAAKDKKNRLRLVERLEKIASININKFTEDEK